MKKLLACLSLLVLTMSLASSAFAWESPFQADWFNVSNVQCVNTNDLKGIVFSESQMGNYFGGVPYKYDPYNNPYHSGYYNTKDRLYVYHTVTGGGGNAYTNLFHAVRITNMESMTYPYGGVLCGQKQVTPAQWIPIQSNAIYNDYHYSVAVRGNTKHYENHGATSINLYIGIEANQ